jgi:MFS transporter, DHA1 family, multidrug resistance protein
MKKLFDRELIKIIAVTGMCYMSVCLLEPVLPLYLKSVGASPSTTGLLMAVIVAGMVAGESWGGWIGDRVGPRLPLIVGTLICAIAVLLLVFVQNIPGIFVVFLFWGISRSTIWGPSRGYVSNAAPLKNKAIFMAIFSTILAVDRSLANLASGFIADNWGYNGNFVVSMGILVIAGLIVVLGLRKKPLKMTKTIQPGLIYPSENPPQVKYNFRSFLLQCVIVALYWLGLGILGAFLPLYSSLVAGLSVTHVGILFTIGASVSAALLIPFGRLADIVDKKILMIIGLLLFGISFLGLVFSQTFISLAVSYAIYNLGSAMFTPSALAYLSLSIPASRQSSSMGLYGAAEDVGFIVGSSAGGFFWNFWGPQSIFIAGAAAGLIGAVLCLSLYPGSRSKSRLSGQ